MAKEKVLSSAKPTSSTIVKSAPKVDETKKYKDAINDIVNAQAKLAREPQNRNFRIVLNQTIVAAGKLL